MAPSLGLAWELAGASATPEYRTERERVLAQLVDDPTALINVRGRDMPSSPDILNFGRRSTAALERCLSDNVDAYIRSSCAVMLEALGDRRALPTLRAALEDWDDSVRRSVASALANMPDPGNIDPLLKLFGRTEEDESTRVAALRALGAISHKRVVRALRAELAKPDDGDDSSPRWQIFDALWANRHLMAEATLVGDTVAALRSDDNGLVDSAAYAAASLRSPRLVPALIPLMDHPWPNIRNKAVYALGRIGDKKATKALLAKLPDVREARMLNNIAFALERLDRAAFYRSIKQVIEHKQATIRLNAAFVLGDVHHSEGLPALKRALKDPSDFVRTSAVVAMGKIRGNKGEVAEAIAALQPFVDHGNLGVRQEAIYAIHRLSGESKADLIYRELFDETDQRKRPSVVHRAALSLGKAMDPRVREYLTNCFVRAHCTDASTVAYMQATATEREKGRVLLAWARSSGGLTATVAALEPSGTLAIASSVFDEDSRGWSSNPTQALRVLGGLGQASVIPLITPLSTSDSAFDRVHALVALARLGDKGAIPKLMQEFDNLPAEYLPRFVRALAVIKETAVRESFVPELEARHKSPRTPLALAAAAVSLHWDPDAAIFRFREALASSDGYERDLAERYLRKNRAQRVTWLLRRVLAREGNKSTHRRVRAILDAR